MEKITIRKLQPGDDRITVGEIYATSWKYAYKGLLPQEYLDTLHAEQWAKKLDCPERHSLVVELGGKLIGISSYGESRTPEYDGWGEVYSIYFLPEYMGKGYGKQLMKAVLAEFKALGGKAVFLWVLKDNFDARKFYEGIGFIYTGKIEEDKIGGKIVHEVQYNYTYTQEAH